MDSNRVLVGFVCLLAAFLAFPVVVSKARGQQGGATAYAGVVSPEKGNAPASGSAAIQERLEPPRLTEQNLVGTEWQFNYQSYKIKLTFAANGVAYATHPMAKALTGLDYIEGHWEVQKERLLLRAHAGGNEMNYEFIISGTRILQMKKGKPAGELQRF